MAQFDVYVNSSRLTKKHYPYILDVQHSVISDLTTRLVIPLGKLSSFGGQNLEILTPVFEYEDLELVLLTPQMAAIPVQALKNPVGTLENYRNSIISAIEFAITGI